jgi:hypothetical protein
MYATDCDGCQSRGCWNFLPIASKFVRKIGREGEAESHTWQRRGRDKRHKDKTDTLFMRRNNQRHRFAQRERERESARESNRPCSSLDVQQNFLQRERNRVLGVAAFRAICNLLLYFLPP